MSKQALKRVRKAIGLPVCREPLPAFAWPGGYPIYYLFADGGVCCPACANKEITQIDDDTRGVVRFPMMRPRCGGFALCGFDVNYEDRDLYCDHCGKEIPAAYAD